MDHVKQYGGSQLFDDGGSPDAPVLGQGGGSGGSAKRVKGLPSSHRVQNTRHK
jgi:hypothetical protein